MAGQRTNQPATKKAPAPMNSIRQVSSLRRAGRWLALDAGVSPSETIFCRMVSAVRLAVRSLRIHDAHLNFARPGAGRCSRALDGATRWWRLNARRIRTPPRNYRTYVLHIGRESYAGGSTGSGGVQPETTSWSVTTLCRSRPSPLSEEPARRWQSFRAAAAPARRRANATGAARPDRRRSGRGDPRLPRRASLWQPRRHAC
jgi:hypothetical protein